MTKLKNDEKAKRSSRQSWRMVALTGGAGALIVLVLGFFFIAPVISTQADFAYTNDCGLQFYDLDSRQTVGDFPDECIIIHSYDFSPDGRQVVYTTDPAITKIGDIYSRTSETLPIEDVSSVAWSPDGSTIAMWAYQGLPSGQTLVLYDVASGEMREHGTYSVRYTSLSWSPNSQELLFAVDHTSDMEIVHLNLVTDELTQLTDDSYNNRYAEWSGSSAIFSRLNHETVRDSLWRIDLGSGNEEKLVEGRTLRASVSPSGRYVTYTLTNEQGYPAVYLLDLEMRMTDQITPHEPAMFLTRWLNDADYGVEGN